MRRDRLEIIPIIEKLPVDKITKSVLINLVMPREGSTWQQAMTIIILSDPERVEKVRSDLYSYPPVALSRSQWQIWLVSFHSALRHWKSNYKIPMYKDVGSIAEPIGDVLISILKILEYISANMHEYNANGTHYMQIFEPIALELHNLIFECPESGGIRAKREEISGYAKSLHCHENSFNSDAYPAIHNFISLVTRISQQDKSNDFKKKFLTKTSSTEKGLVTALQSLGVAINKNFAEVDVSKESLKFNIGQGKGGEIINAAHIKKMLR